MKKKMGLAVCAVAIAAFCLGRASMEFPELNAAKRSLVEAKNHLNKAMKEFGGHRAKAADAVDKAIKEVDEAILYGDKK